MVELIGINPERRGREHSLIARGVIAVVIMLGALVDGFSSEMVGALVESMRMIKYGAGKPQVVTRWSSEPVEEGVEYVMVTSKAMREAVAHHEANFPSEELDEHLANALCDLDSVEWDNRFGEEEYADPATIATLASEVSNQNPFIKPGECELDFKFPDRTLSMRCDDSMGDAVAHICECINSDDPESFEEAVENLKYTFANLVRIRSL